MKLRGKLYSFINILIQTITFAFLLFFLLIYEKSFRAIIYATMASSLFESIVLICFTKEYWQFKKIKINWKLMQELLSFGLPLVPVTLSSSALNSVDKLALRTMVSFEELGLYTAAFKIVALLSIIQGIFMTAWVPIAYKWHEDNVSTKQFEFISTVILGIMSVLFAIILLMRNVIILFLGNEYRNITSIFVFLLFVPISSTIAETTGMGISFSKKTKYHIYTVVGALVLNLIGNYLLVPKYGAVGAAIATCIAYFVFFWGKTLISRHLWYKIGLYKYIMNFVLLLCLMIIVYYGYGMFKEIIITLFIFSLNIYYILKGKKVLNF
jgi:O-antigen/teichoic acid export membrane protein